MSARPTPHHSTTLAPTDADGLFVRVMHIGRPQGTQSGGLCGPYHTRASQDDPWYGRGGACPRPGGGVGWVLWGTCALFQCIENKRYILLSRRPVDKCRANSGFSGEEGGREQYPSILFERLEEMVTLLCTGTTQGETAQNAGIAQLPDP